MMPPNSLEVSEAIGGFVGQKRQRDSRTPRRFARFRRREHPAGHGVRLSLCRFFLAGERSLAGGFRAPNRTVSASSSRRLRFFSLKVSWFALQKLAATRLADKFAVANRHLATDSDHVGPTFDSHAFKRIVVHVHRLRFD